MDGTAQPTDSNKPQLDMDAINAAVNASAGNDPNLQGTFDVNDISLDDTPTTAAELEQQMKKNPEMSLAGTVIDKTVSTEDAVKAPQVKLSADVATTTPQDPSIIADKPEDKAAADADATDDVATPATDAPADDATEAPKTDAATPEAPKADADKPKNEASFVGGDLEDEKSAEDTPAEEPKEDTTTLNYSDPVDNFEKDDAAPAEKPADAPADDAAEAPKTDDIPAETTVTEAPAATPEDSKKKDKKKSKDATPGNMPSNGMLPKEKVGPFEEGGIFRSNAFIAFAVIFGVLAIIGIVIAVAILS